MKKGAINISPGALFDRLIAFFFFYGITYIQGLSSIDVKATQAHGLRRIAHTPIPSFGSKRKG